VTVTLPAWLAEIPAEEAHPAAFATVSGAHLYGFPSAGSDRLTSEATSTAPPRKLR
jgi:uncharacterized protein